MTLQNSEEWQFGRRGEILNIGIWARFGFTLLDISVSANQRAPLLHEVAADIVSPDQLVMRRATFFMDTKTKERPLLWRGGQRGERDQMPAGRAHGIDRRSYESFCRVAEQTGKPVVIAVLCVEDAELLANTLTGLGEPYPSINPEHDLVNWPAFKFRRVAEFDPRRLRHYFYRPDGSRRTAPDAMPKAASLQAVVEWLRPRQAEIEWLRDDLLRRLEDEWEAQ